MINVLIVEDEPPIARALKNSICSIDSDFCINTIAINGKKAIEEIQKQKYDVVFTDIRMPVMDGLELLEYLDKNYPDIITVMVSGYSDFEYAQKAVKMHAYDYILKPVSPEKLKPLIEKLKIKAEKNRQLKNKLFDGENLKTKKMCTIIYALAGTVSYEYDDGLAPSVSFWSDINANELIEELTGKSKAYMTFTGKTAGEKIIIIEDLTEIEAEQIANTFFKRITHLNSLYVTVAWKYGINLSDATEEMLIIRGAMHTNIVPTKSRIFNCNDKIIKTIRQFYSYDEVLKITDLLDIASFEKLKQTLSQILEKFEKENATEEELISFLDMVVNNCCLKFSKNSMNIKKRVKSAISNFYDYSSFCDDFYEILIEMAENNKNEKQPKLIGEIEIFLKENFSDSTVTNTMLSQKFGFVPSYISSLFKQAKGVSPAKYLTTYRIKKAKEIMNNNPDLMIKEIANMVGFNDAYYFSKTFKKETGSWPTEFQK